MSDTVDVQQFDRDEAVAEAIDGLQNTTRRDVLRRAGVVAGTAAAATLIPATGAFGRQGGSTANDVKILNYALTLEYLEAAFYAEVLAKGTAIKDASVRNFAETVAAHEATHVSALQGALGAKAVSSPKFDFKGTTASQKSFLKTSKVLEDTGVSAYQGQAPLIHNNAYLAVAGSILAVEARHAAWVRDLLGAGKTVLPAPLAFNAPMSMSQVLSAVKSTGFIKK